MPSPPPPGPDSSDVNFVKITTTPRIQIMSTTSRLKALALSEKGLIGKFTGIWPSPKTMDTWINKNWIPLISEGLQHCFCGKGFFTFLFVNKEDKDLIFRSGPYFMGPRGLYLNRWSSSFDPEKDVPSTVLVWVRLPHLPLHYWNDETLQEIKNSLGNYIDKAEPKGPLFSCARICVEVYMEKGLPEAVKGRLRSSTFQVKEVPRIRTFCYKQPKGSSRKLKKKSRGRMAENRKGSFTFLFENKVDRDLIFMSKP